MMCMTELHGGVCHRTSTPHKSGNKMKEKKKKTQLLRVLCSEESMRHYFCPHGCQLEIQGDVKWYSHV